MMYKEKLAKLRGQIDAIDREMIPLFCKRMQISNEVGSIKADANLAITDEGRERKVIEAAMELADGSGKMEAAAFMQNIIALSKLRQRAIFMPSADLHFPLSAQRKTADVKVVYQGVRGAWGEQGAIKLFPNAQLSSLEFFENVFNDVKSGKADYGVIPIENSHTGAIGEVYDLLRRHGCYIVGQAWIPINQCLLAKPGSSINSIREVLSHPQGFGQCQRFLKNRNWLLTTCSNTAVAAQEVSGRKDPYCAAIGSRQAAEEYGLEVLASDIVDQTGNQTRFISIAAQPLYSSESDTISVTFSTLNVSGALCAVLQSFMLADINLTRIESRPVSADRYRFFTDVQASILDEKTVAALKDASIRCEYFEILGCYKSNGEVLA